MGGTLNLYDLRDFYAEALENAIDEDGQIVDEDLFNFLKEIDDEKKNKVLNVACMIKSCLAEAEAFKAEKKTLEHRQKVLINKADSLTRYLVDNVKEGEKFKDARAAITWSQSSFVAIGCPVEDLPEEFQKVVRTAKKTDIKAKIKAGGDVTYCFIDTKQNIQIK